jgi:hypothetical protein
MAVDIHNEKSISLKDHHNLDDNDGQHGGNSLLRLKVSKSGSDFGFAPPELTNFARSVYSTL